MNKAACLLAALLLTGCGNRETTATHSAVPAAALTNAATAHQPPPSDSFGSAAVDVITQRRTIEVGKKAKATIDAAAAKENNELEAVLNEK
jgi:hypothetical protein